MRQRELYTSEDVANILSEFRRNRGAQIAGNISDQPQTVHVYELDLSVASLDTAPFKISSSFLSVYLQEATDLQTEIKIKLGTRNEQQKPITLRKNSALKFERFVTEAYLHWEAQAGKTCTLLVFTDAQFESGQLISVNAGGVSISDGESFECDEITLGVATATEIFAQDTTRKVGTFRNSDTASIWVGTSSVDATGAFIEVKPGEIFEWRNTAQLYAYSVLGCDIPIMEEF